MTADKLTKILLNLVTILGVILIITAAFKTCDTPKPKTVDIIPIEHPAYFIYLEDNMIIVKDPITENVIYTEMDNNQSPLSQAIWKDNE